MSWQLFLSYYNADGVLFQKQIYKYYCLLEDVLLFTICDWLL